MDEKEFNARVARQVSNILAGYRNAERLGFAPKAISVTRYQSQQDFDAYKPEDAGSDFNEENRQAGPLLRRFSQGWEFQMRAAMFRTAAKSERKMSKQIQT